MEASIAAERREPARIRNLAPRLLISALILGALALFAYTLARIAHTYYVETNDKTLYLVMLAGPGLLFGHSFLAILFWIRGLGGLAHTGRQYGLVYGFLSGLTLALHCATVYTVPTAFDQARVLENGTVLLSDAGPTARGYWNAASVPVSLEQDMTVKADADALASEKGGLIERHATMQVTMMISPNDAFGRHVRQLLRSGTALADLPDAVLPAWVRDDVTMLVTRKYQGDLAAIPVGTDLRPQFSRLPSWVGPVTVTSRSETFSLP